MRLSRIVNAILLIILLTSSLFSLHKIVHAKNTLQTTEFVTGTGQICNDQGSCIGMELTFNPSGGEVTGSFSGTFDYTFYDEKLEEKSKIFTNGTLSGTYSGGDGGAVDGLANVTSEGAIYVTGTKGITTLKNFKVPYSDTTTGSWSGIIYADGTASGKVFFGGGETGSNWSITYDPNAITTDGISTTSPTENPSVPTLAQIDLTPEPFKDPWIETEISTERMHTWIEIDEIIAQTIGQDEALIARDKDGLFYVVDNQGNRMAIPPATADALRIENSFALLGNRELLASNPTIQALVAKEGEEVLDAINGAGALQFYEPPDWLQKREYFWIMTQCYQGICCGYSRISLTKTSGYIDSSAVASSEHSSVRGTINGGGDFIYEPKPMLVGGLILSLIQTEEANTFPAYLGVLAADRPDSAEVIQVQLSSPAEQAGLQIGDLIYSVSGTFLNDQTTLNAILDQYKGGDEITLGITRGGETLSLDLTLAEWIPPIIETPAALFYTTGRTKLIYDIGLNGVTAILVLQDAVRVVEPVTNTQVDVQAGQALIVVPGEPVGSPFMLADTDVNKWWENPSTTESSSPTDLPPSGVSSVQGYKGYKDFNPFPNADEENLYWIISIVLGILYIIVLLILIFKKEKQ